MKLLGVQLRKPTFNEVTASAVMALGLWMVYLGVAKSVGSVPDPITAGGMLVVIFWGCVCARFGIRIDRGLPHLVLNVLFGAVLLLAYQATMAAVG
jgi:hypothetical protein